jgi:hypothetical protein
MVRRGARVARRRFRFDRFHVFVGRFEDMAARTHGGPTGLDHAWIEDDAGLRRIDAVAKADGYDHRPRQVRQLLAAGTRLAAALEDGQPVGWCLFQPVRQTSYQWLHIHGGPGWMFGIGEYVRRDRRGRRIGPDLVRFVSRSVLAEGYTMSGSIAEMRNRSAYISRTREGAHRRGWVAGLRLEGGHALVASDRGLAAGRYDAERPFVYQVRSPA